MKRSEDFVAMADQIRSDIHGEVILHLISKNRILLTTVRRRLSSSALRSEVILTEREERGTEAAKERETVAPARKPQKPYGTPLVRYLDLPKD